MRHTPCGCVPYDRRTHPLYCLPLCRRRGDACERRLWRRKRARRSGRIKATDKWALPTQTEPLIQQDMSPPYRNARNIVKKLKSFPPFRVAAIDNSDKKGYNSLGSCLNTESFQSDITDHSCRSQGHTDSRVHCRLAACRLID